MEPAPQRELWGRTAHLESFLTKLGNLYPSWLLREGRDVRKKVNNYSARVRPTLFTESGTLFSNLIEIDRLMVPGRTKLSD